MKIIKISKDGLDTNITKEMKDWFFERTNKHISMVRKYMQKIVDEFPQYEELLERMEDHDSPKFKEPELTPYIWITWKYKCEAKKKDFKSYSPPENIDELIQEATEHHIKSQRHHPEYHCSKESNLINSNNRDEIPDEMIDATKMNDIDLCEMCADWMAVSEERGNTPIEWENKNVNKRWKFSEHQKDLIYEILNAIWE
jgi:hypothetical protein